MLATASPVVDERRFSSSCKLHYCGLNSESDETYTGALVLRPEKSLCILAAEDGSVTRSLSVDDLVLEQPECSAGVVYLRRINDDPDRFIAFSFKDLAEAEELAAYLRSCGHRSTVSVPPSFAPLGPHNVDECIELLKDAKDMLACGQQQYSPFRVTIGACVSRCLDEQCLQSLWAAERACARDPVANAGYAAKLSELLVRIINIAGRATTLSMTSHELLEHYLVYYYEVEQEDAPGGSVASQLRADDLVADFLRDLGADDVSDDSSKDEAPAQNVDISHSGRLGEGAPASQRFGAKLTLREDIATLEGADPLAILLSDSHVEGCFRVLETSPLGHKRGDFLSYWRSVIRFLGEDLLEENVADPMRRNLIRMAALLSARIMYLRDVVLPRFLEDHVIQHATVVSNALQTSIWANLKLDGLEGILRIVVEAEPAPPECAPDEDRVLLVMQMILSFQRNLKNLTLQSLKELFMPLANRDLMLALWRLVGAVGNRVDGGGPTRAMVAAELLYFTVAILSEDIMNVVFQDDEVFDQIFRSVSSVQVLALHDLTTVTYVTDVIKILFREKAAFTETSYRSDRLRGLTRLILAEIPEATPVAELKQLICIKTILLGLLKEAILANPLRCSGTNLLDCDGKNFSFEAARISVEYHLKSKRLGIGVQATSFISQVIKFVRTIEFCTNGTFNGSGGGGDALEELLKVLPTDHHGVLPFNGGAGNVVEACVLGLVKAATFKAQKCKPTLRALKNLINRNRPLLEKLNKYFTQNRQLTLFNEWRQIVAEDEGLPDQLTKKSPNKRHRVCLPESSPAKRIRSCIDEHTSIVSMLGGGPLDLAQKTSSGGVTVEVTEELEIKAPVMAARSPTGRAQTTMKIKL